MLKLKLTTLTPVHIGSGENVVITRFGGYVFSNRRLYIIDQKKLQQKLNELVRNGANNAVDEYIDALNNRNYNSLRDFLTRQRISLEEISQRSYQINERYFTKEIYETIKTGNRPYIPGSSLKGAIKTALFNQYIDDSEEDVLRSNSQLRNIAYIESDFLNSEDLLKDLRCSDTEPFQISDLSVEKILLHYMDRPRRNNRFFYYEAINNPNTTSCCINTTTINGTANNEGILLENENLNISDLFKKINAFSIRNLKREANILLFNEELNSIREKLNEILRLAENFNGSGAVLRLGRNKTFFDNTIALNLTEEEIRSLGVVDIYEDNQQLTRPANNENFNVLQNLLQELRNNPDINEGDEDCNEINTPKTRKFICDGDTPTNLMGWIKIEKIQENEG